MLELRPVEQVSYHNGFKHCTSSSLASLPALLWSYSRSVLYLDRLLKVLIHAGYLGIQFLTTAAGMPGDCHYLKIRLQLEQQRLLNWGEVSGLLDMSSGQCDKGAFEETFGGATRHLVVDQLMQVQLLVNEFEKWQLRYNRDRPADTREDLEARSDTGLSGETLGAENQMKSFPRRSELLNKALRGVREMQHVPKYFVWASWDKAKFESMLEHLTRFNDGIFSIMGNNVQRGIHQATQETNRAVLQLYTKVDDLDQLVKALKLELGQKRKDSAETGQIFLGTKNREDVRQVEQLTELATFKSFNQSIEERQALLSAEQKAHRHEIITGMEWLSLTPADIEIICDSNEPKMSHRAARCRAMYRESNQNRVPVWIEWKYYERPPRGQASPEPLIMERLQKLAVLLHKKSKPAGFRVPQCIGYLEERTTGTVRRYETTDECRIGFVFEYPDAAVPSADPISLLQVLGTCQQGEEPSLTERMELALTIVTALSCLHLVNWLHKGLRSANIVFFPDKIRDSGVDLSKPYLCGFDFSRPSSRDEMTEMPPHNPEYDVYRHPHAHGQSPGTSFHQAYDIYSVGVILVEIAHWRSIEQVLKIDDLSTARPAITRRVREKLLTKATMKQIAARTGFRYQNVVQVCLDGSLEFERNGSGGDDMGALLLSEAFHERVIKRLVEIQC